MRSRLFAAAVVLSLPQAAGAQGPQLAAPSKQHEALARDAGVWDAEASLFSAPDAAPATSKAVETNRQLGQLWLVSDFEGELMGQKFSGHSTLGYDPVKKKYIGTWIDTISPFMQTMEGDYDVATHTLTMTMTGTDFMTGKTSTVKTVTRYIDENHKTFEIHAPAEGPDGKPWKVMEIKYTRRK